VGINLLREGLDLPEVSLVAILDADKEGYLRSATSLIQTAGRAARHVDGRVLMYAEQVTPSMRQAIDETARRRRAQEQHNRAHGITPTGIRKAIRDLGQRLKQVAESRESYSAATTGDGDLQRLIEELETEMKAAARAMEFERAALLRDQVAELRATLSDALRLEQAELARMAKVKTTRRSQRSRGSVSRRSWR
jgi:excinuclease ABC subunit B